MQLKNEETHFKMFNFLSCGDKTTAAAERDESELNAV